MPVYQLNREKTWLLPPTLDELIPADHNSLWRFYRAHRKYMRSIFKQSVRTAVKLGLVDMAIQAVDGTKVGANAAKKRTYTAAQLVELQEKTDSSLVKVSESSTS